MGKRALRRGLSYSTVRFGAGSKGVFDALVVALSRENGHVHSHHECDLLSLPASLFRMAPSLEPL
jgi:hypothetical protein